MNFQKVFCFLVYTFFLTHYAILRSVNFSYKVNHVLVYTYEVPAGNFAHLIQLISILRTPKFRVANAARTRAFGR